MSSNRQRYLILADVLKIKVENVVLMMSDEDRKDMIQEGKITLTCEFCSKDYQLDPAIIKSKIKNQENRDKVPD